MAGHSKWKNIQHRKGKQDAARGQLFTKLAREIFVAARQGGGDPEMNFRLRVAIDKARVANVPSDNIQRTIDKALGNLDGVTYDELIYEGYTPGGAAVLIELMTDNRNRTAGEIRHLFTKRGGRLGETNSVAWIFERRGLLVVQVDGAPSEDDLLLLALESGADDVERVDEQYDVWTSPAELHAVKAKLEEAGLRVAEASLQYVPTTSAPLTGEEARQAISLVETLEEHDDVQSVYTNMEIEGDLDKTNE